MQSELFIVAYVLLFAVIFLTVSGGVKLGNRNVRRNPELKLEGHGSFESAVFGLMALLVAFTFAGAANRYEARRDLITKETNAIDVAYRRIDLVAPAAQAQLRNDFRAYVTERLDFYQKYSDLSDSDKAREDVLVRQNKIWNDGVEATRHAGTAPTTLFIQALNDVFDVTTERAVALTAHPPVSVYVLLGVAILSASLLAGYGMGIKQSRSLIHTLGFAFIMATALYVIFDMEFPRFGFIRIDAADKILVELRDSMK